LENIGRNLETLYIGIIHYITKLCSNLNSLFIIFKYNEVEALKVILNSCQQLKSIIKVK